jgi:GNAT superfamily N-acetyltransferase
MELRPYGGPADALALQKLASRWWPRCWHPGGTGWETAIEQQPSPMMLATTADGAVAGWAGLLGRQIVLQADPAQPEVAGALADWAVTAAGPGDLTVGVFAGDETAAAAVAAAGFTPQTPEVPLLGLFRKARAEDPVLPPGYRARSVKDGEEAARVEAHRAAWRPIEMPWPGEIPTYATPEATSRFTMANYVQVRRTWLYDQSRDLLIEAPDGSLAACCIVWWDPATGSSEIEPLGVLPAHRRRGLATALCAAAGSLTAALSGEQIYINTYPLPDYPAPAQTYLAAGFDLVRRGEYLRRAA